MVSPLFRVMMLTFVQGLSVSRRCERASESSEAENERDLFFFVRGTTEGSRRTHILPIRILMRLLLTKKMAGSLRTYCT
jgi:hypothetical protein